MLMFWDDVLGIGYYPVDPDEAPYDASYFKKYQGYTDTDLGRAINEYRLGVVRGFVDDLPVLDVGIGCGQFVSARGGQTFGFDVNPEGLRWLFERGLYRSITEPIECMTFWDSLEHISHPRKIIANASRFVMMSIPIFSDAAHAQGSKHFRPDEHYWYFTNRGLRWFMQAAGFECIYQGDEESRMGREDIWTYVFRRCEQAT